MARWIPVLASVGLVSLMVMPAPGPWGLVIGASCCVAISLAAFLRLVDRVATHLAIRWAQRVRLRTRRRVHAGSGMLRRSGEPQAVVPAAPPRLSPVQERAHQAALRREAGRLEPFRLR